MQVNPLLPFSYVTLLTVVTLAVALGSTLLTGWDRPWRTRALMVLGRTLGVLGVLAMLWNPGQWREWRDQRDRGWAIALDSSRSMGTGDLEGETRLETGGALAGRALKASARPESVSLYHFADELSELGRRDLGRLAATGSTDVAGALSDLLGRERAAGRGLDGLLLLSDGRIPGGADAHQVGLLAAADGIPVFPLVLGGEVEPRDLAVSSPNRRHVCFVGQPVSLTATIRNSRMGDVRLAAELLDAAGAVLQTQTVDLREGTDGEAHFSLPPQEAGFQEYTVRVEPRAGEANSANNSAALGVSVLDGQLQVLMLEGEPYWDTKFLSHFLRAQTNIAMTAVYRVAADRFFKVAGDQSLEATTVDAFPATQEAMDAFDLVVVGRGAEHLIDGERGDRLMQFVTERGGCLLFVRGKPCRGDCPQLESLLPVEFGDPLRAAFRMEPLLAGEQARLFGGLLPGRHDERWQQLPLLERAHSIRRLKSFATVLAEGIGESAGAQRFPAMVSRRQGNGLVVLVNGDGLWRWGFFPEVTDGSELYRDLWVRLFQWAVSFTDFAPGTRYALQLDRSLVREGDAVRVRVIARGKGELPAPRVVVAGQDGREIALGLAADAGNPNNWLGVIDCPRAGVFRVRTVPEEDELPTVALLQVQPPPGELDELSADPEWLALVAELSGGRVVTPPELAELVDEMEGERAAKERGRVEWDPAWDHWGALLCVLGMLACEWIVRRRQGLL